MILWVLAGVLSHIKVKKTCFWLPSHFRTVPKAGRHGRRQSPSLAPSWPLDGWMPSRWWLWWGWGESYVFKFKGRVLGQRVNALHYWILSEVCSKWENISLSWQMCEALTLIPSESLNILWAKIALQKNLKYKRYNLLWP